MTAVDQLADEYFASMSPLAKKVLQDQDNLQKACGAKWDKFSRHQKDQLIDKYLIDPDITEKYEKYTSTSSKLVDEQDCFPKLKVLCGEKIVVDFDNNDGWTWRDEHSAPFSWETRSQNELSLFDEVDEGTIADITLDRQCETPKEPPKKPKRTKKSRSPDRDNLAFRPEKSIWDSPFLTADRGLDSGYPSSHSSDHSKGSEETEDLLNKFGLNLNLNGEKEEVGAADSSFTSQDHGKHLLVESSTIRTESDPVLVPRRTESPSTDSLGSQPSSSRVGKIKESSDKVGKRGKKNKKHEADDSLVIEQVEQRRTQDDQDSSLEISRVYMEDPGESSDYTVAAESSSSMMYAEPEGMSMDRGTSCEPERGQDNLALDDSHDSDVLDGWTLDLLSKNGTQPLLKKTQPLTVFQPKGDGPKTGFDFLDNW